MSKMNEYLSNIMKARYGKDVRQSIHDGIKECDSVARTAQSSATASMQTATAKASEALTASAEATQKAQEAIKAAEQAKTYAENAQAVTGVNIGTKDTAGIIKGGDNHIAADGTLQLTASAASVMPNSHKGRLMFEEIGGVSEQESTTGAQLVDIEDFELAKPNTRTKSVDTDLLSAGSYHLNIKLDGTATNVGVKVQYIENGTIVRDDNTSVVVLVSGDNILKSDYEFNRLYFFISNEQSDGVTAKFEDIMLSVESLPYESYTGGQASPNPSYPQEIKNVVVNGARTHGKNLLKNIATSTTTNGITFTVNNDGTVTANGTATAVANFAIFKTIPMVNGRHFNVIQLGGSYSGDIYHVAYDANFVGGKDSKLNTASPLNDSVTYSRFRISVKSGAVCNNLKVGFMVSTIDYDTYEPYTESSITLSSPIELCGIGDVQDVIDIENGVVRRRIGECTVTSENNINVYNNYPSINIENVKNYGTSDVSATDILAMSNYFAGASWGKNSLETVFPYWGESRISFKTAMSATELKEFVADKELEGNPLKVYFVLAEETTEPLPIADRIALNSLLTYEGATYIEFDSAVEPTIEAEYGTSKVGGYALEGLLVARNNEIRLNALETA